MSEEPQKIRPIDKDHLRAQALMARYNYAKLRVRAGNLDAEEIYRGIVLTHEDFIWLCERAMKATEYETGIKSVSDYSDWQDMALAPRDGTKILIDQREFGPEVFSWMGDSWRGTDWEGSPALDPVGWMHLPPSRKLPDR